MMKKEIQKKYSNEEITVVWKPDKCIHSKICFNGLSSVFDPNNRPWVNIEGSDSETIVNQINKCPSGALSYFKNNEDNSKSIKEETSVEVALNGPLIIKGNLKIKLVDGTESNIENINAFCRCGHSQKKPFCDGAHAKVGFKD